MRYLLDTTDILIIAHAITERLTLISSDRKFKFYENQGLSFVYNKKPKNILRLCFF